MDSTFDPDHLQHHTMTIVISQIDVIDILCNKMSHLKKNELQSTHSLLSQYRLYWQGWLYWITEFGIDTSNIPPLSVPFRWVTIHQHGVVKQIIEKYEQLELVEPINSPFQAATVLVKKKNISSSTSITDQCSTFKNEEHMILPPLTI